jgi:hypothetical protein
MIKPCMWVTTRATNNYLLRTGLGHIFQNCIPRILLDHLEGLLVTCNARFCIANYQQLVPSNLVTTSLVKPSTHQ